ncbi:hypothetical protein L2E82_39086 [Cichorium intybus]|uniref:Uncharacterized protein n=1 Tax=Cichorium intybus TaxID=13427 RepID=A0ACB9AH80_CICIN|nr:hypothetical protein L2E82_39086 [Cichorium intybus]
MSPVRIVHLELELRSPNSKMLLEINWYIHQLSRGETMVYFMRIGLLDFIQSDCSIVLELQQVVKLSYLEN